MWIRHCYNKLHVFLVLKIAFILRFELTFYDNSKLVFFSTQRKKKIGFYKFSFRFLYFGSTSRISTPIPHIPTQIPRLPTIIPRIPTLIPRIPTPFPTFPAFPPRFPAFPPPFSTFPPKFPAFPPLFSAFPLQFPHSSHSVPRFPILAFTDSRSLFWLLEFIDS